jgi:hypothetical protein
MKKRPRLIHIFIGCNIALGFWHIFRYSLVTQESYASQKLAQQQQSLLTKKQDLEKELHALHSQQSAYDYAHTKLDMHAIRLEQIHTVPYHG